MMKTLQRVCIVVLILLAVSAKNSVSQVPELILNKKFQHEAQGAIHSLYNFQFKKAGQQLSSWKNKYPHDPVWMLLDGVKYWWQIISDLHNTSKDKKFIKMMKKTDYAAAKILYKQPGNADALLVRMAANGFIARIYSDRDEWVKSLQAAHKAYKLYGVLKKNTPDLPDIKMIDGLKLYYSAYLPKAYPVVKALSAFLPKGNEKKGLKYLKYASKHAIFVQAEATYFLGNIYYNYEHQYPEAVHYFKLLYHKYPRNNYYTRLLVRSLYKMEKYKKDLSVINASLKRWEENDYPHPEILKSDLWYWKARILYKNEKDDQALTLFGQSLQLTQKLPRYRYRENYVRAAYYSGIILAQKGNNKEAIRYFNMAKNGKTDSNYQKKAQQKLKELAS
jgi:hypothetical protein